MASGTEWDFFSGADFDAVFDLIEEDLLAQDRCIDLQIDEDILEVCCSFVLCFIFVTKPITEAAFFDLLTF